MTSHCQRTFLSRSQWVKNKKNVFTLELSAVTVPHKYNTKTPVVLVAQ